MRTAGFVAFFLFVASSLHAGSKFNEIKYFGSNPGNLKMYIYLPSGYEKNTEKLPVVVALHGCSQKAKTIAKQSGWNDLADKHRFIVIYPQTRRINNASKCFNWFYRGDTQMGKGEVASIKSMVDYTIDHYKVDTSNVFVYGLSAGAAMAVALMANYPDMINTGAIFAGGPYGAATNLIAAWKVMRNPGNYSPEVWGKMITDLHHAETEYPKIIVVHGLKDRIVNKRNSREIIDQWTYLHQIDTIPDRVENNYANNPLVERSCYCDHQDNEYVIFYKISKTGHKLSVDPGEGELQGGKTGLFSKDNNFFSTYYVAKDFGLTKD